MLHTKPPRTPSDALRAAFVILQGIGGHAEHVWEASKLYEDFAERLAYLTRSIAWLKAKVKEKTWRVPPVDFETFCNAPRLLNKNGSLWKAVLAEGRKLNNGHYVEALLTGGIGVGKTHLAIYTQAYQIYLMSCMVSTHEPFGLDPASDIVTVFQSINKNLALSVDYRAFRTIVSESPYFAKEFPFDDSRESEMRFPRHIVVKPVSGSDTAAIGQNVIGGIMDEVNFMAVVEDSKMTRDGSVYDQATSNYTSIARRRESRFMVMGQLPGMLCLVSSRNYPGQFSDVVEERAKKDPRIFVYDKRQWEVRPERFSGETFRVFVGDQSRNPRILEDSDPVAPQDERLVWAVPIEFKSKFEDGLMGAVRDILGLSTMALFPFMTNADAIAKCFGKVQPICSMEACDFVTTRPVDLSEADGAPGGAALLPYRLGALQGQRGRLDRPRAEVHAGRSRRIQGAAAGHSVRPDPGGRSPARRRDRIRQDQRADLPAAQQAEHADQVGDVRPVPVQRQSSDHAEGRLRHGLPVDGRGHDGLRDDEARLLRRTNRRPDA